MISVWLVVTSRLQFEDNISRKLEGLCALQSISQHSTISFNILQFEENIFGEITGTAACALYTLCKQTTSFLPRIIFAQYSSHDTQNTQS